MKICRTCGISKSLGEFGFNVSKPDGLQSSCKECRRIINKRHYEKTKHIHSEARAATKQKAKAAARAYVLDFLRRNPCVDCGEDDIIVLEFDHLRDKWRGVSRMVSDGSNISSLAAEIDKCEVVCANDHRRRTALSFGSYRLDFVNSQ